MNKVWQTSLILGIANIGDYDQSIIDLNGSSPNIA